MESVTISATPAQLAAWASAAGDAQIGAWLAALADNAVAQAQPREFPLTVHLKHPVDFGKECITDLVFRRGKLGDMKGIRLTPNGIDTDQIMTVASRLCGQSPKVIDMLDVDDAGEVIDIALDFYARYLTAGKKP